MPMYDYTCSNGHTFEAMNKVVDRATSTCECGEIGKQRMINPPVLDPKMWTPGMMMKWRKDAERRGRGTDMTRANREQNSEQTHREAHAKRQAMGENPIVTNG